MLREKIAYTSTEKKKTPRDIVSHKHYAYPHLHPVTFTQQGINKDIDELLQMDLNEVYKEFF